MMKESNVIMPSLRTMTLCLILERIASAVRFVGAIPGQQYQSENNVKSVGVFGGNSDSTGPPGAQLKFTEI